MKSILNRLHEYFIKFLKLMKEVNNKKFDPVILSFPSYANGSKVRLIGRVVERITEYDFIKSKNSYKHFVQVIKLFITIKYENIKVLLISQDSKLSTITDQEGFFNEVFDVGNTKMNLKLSATVKTQAISTNTNIIRPTVNSKNIIISDIDDTIIKSKAISFTSLIVKTLFYPPSKRQSFPETSTVYQKLKKGETGNENNLFFYVSSSSWNIYPILKGFLEINHFPRGVVLLQDVVSEKKRGHSSSHGHKINRISEIIEMYPELPLTLIGDAGQEDPNIYLEVAKLYPNKVKNIYIRKSWWTDAVKDFDHINEEILSRGINLIYFDHITEIV